MKKIKKPISILLSVLMVFSLFAVVPFTASAAVGDFVPETEYLTFTAEEAGSSVTLNYTNGTLKYNKNNSDWVDYTKGAQIDLASAGDSVRFRGKDTKFSDSNHVSIGGKVACSGNIMSLRLDDTGMVQGLSDLCFYSMFRDCTGLTAAPKLPETTLARYCYNYMFSGCKSLTTAPALPATTLAEYCYSYMFDGCESLTTAPELPATTLVSNCYQGMFNGCKSLTTAPELPATTLMSNCYNSMFYGCKSLTTAPALPATTLASYGYSSMFYDCTSLTTAPALPATTLATYCYNNMFFGCISLTTAPELPATTLKTSCYQNMFSGCTSLTTAPALPATTLVTNCYRFMFNGCTGIKLSETQTAEYSIPYSVPSGENGTTTTSNALNNMFAGTGGTFAGTPTFNKTYYMYVPTYTVTWKNADGTTLKTDTVEKDAVPAYTGTTPEKADDERNTYTFSGWTDGTNTYGKDDALPAVTGDVTYTATYTSTRKEITGSFGNLNWVIDTDGVLTFSGSGAIPQDAFKNNGDVKKVIINDSVTELGAYAFYGCPNLTEVDIQNPSVSFEATTHHFAYSGVTTVTLPEGMTTIPQGMFRLCGALTTVDLPSTIKTIEDLAFMDSGLQSISVPEGATYDRTSFMTDSLQSLTLEGSSPMTFTGGEFTFLLDAATVYIPEGSTYVYSNRTLYVKDPSNVDAQVLLEIAQEEFNQCIENGYSPEEALGFVNDMYGDYYSVTTEGPFTVTLKEGDKCEGVFGGATIGKYVPAPTPEQPEVIKDCTYKQADSEVYANVPFMPVGSDYSSLLDGAINGLFTYGTIQMVDVKGYSYKFYDQTGTEIAATLSDSANVPGSRVGLSGDVTLYRKLFDLNLPENFEKLYIVATAPTTYTVTWKNGDTVLKTDTVVEGTAPAYTGTTPEKAEDAQNTYTFSGWTDGTNTYGATDTLPAVTGDITYTATFDASAKYTYTLDGNNVTITGYNGTDQALTIPSEIDGHPVVTIGADAFYKNETIKSVVIPDTVTNVGSCAFLKCPNLTSVTLPDSLKTIGDKAFAYCDKLTGLVIPDSVTHIDDYAVEYCPKLTTLVIGKKVEFIGEDAFEGCTTLNNVVLPDSLKTMEEFAFYECMALEEINIPAGITNIARFTFFNCEKLEAVNFARPTSEQTLRFAANVFTKGNNYVPIGTVLRYSGEGNYALFDGDTMVAEGTDLSTLANKTLTWRPAYTVTWANWENSVIKTDTVVEGNAPAYTGTAPEKAEDDTYTYTFSGWTDGTNTYGASDTLPAVTGDITYTATFTATEKQLNGPQDDGFFYLDDVKQIRYQLIQWHGDYYFINDGDKYAKNAKLYLSNTYVAGTGLAAGLYEFGADGKMQLKNGPQDDGYFYENGIRSNKLYRFVEFEGDWYFIYDGYKYAKNARLYLSGAFLEGTDFAPGYFDFDADGKYYIPEELPEGANADGYFYINGVKQTRYQLIKYGNDYYFINDNDKYAKNTKLYLSDTFVSGTDLPAGLYEFGADGKMIISALKNGPQDDGYFYINGARCQKLYRFVEFEGDWYFINDGYKYAKNARLYLGNAFLEGTDFAPGYFVFGADGKLVTA